MNSREEERFQIAIAHMNALPILLCALKECKAGKDITPMQADNILYEWDQAREIKGEV